MYNTSRVVPGGVPLPDSAADGADSDVLGAVRGLLPRSTLGGPTPSLTASAPLVLQPQQIRTFTVQYVEGLACCCRVVVVLLSCWCRVVAVLLSCWCRAGVVLVSCWCRVVAVLVSCCCQCWAHPLARPLTHARAPATMVTRPSRAHSCQPTASRFSGHLSPSPGSPAHDGLVIVLASFAAFLAFLAFVTLAPRLAARYQASDARRPNSLSRPLRRSNDRHVQQYGTTEGLGGRSGRSPDDFTLAVHDSPLLGASSAPGQPASVAAAYASGAPVDLAGGVGDDPF